MQSVAKDPLVAKERIGRAPNAVRYSRSQHDPQILMLHGNKSADRSTTSLMSPAAPVLAFAMLCSALFAQQRGEPTMRAGTWELRFVHCDRL